jgi:hypothetical protein
MTNPWSRWPAAFLALALALAAGACGDGDGDPDEGAAATTSTAAPGAGTTEESTTTAAPAADPDAGAITIEIAGGSVVGGVRREKVTQGDEVTLRVTSDVADELHVHTYDVTADLEPGETVELTFPATIPGIHEVELEKRHQKVLEIEVAP